MENKVEEEPQKKKRKTNQSIEKEKWSEKQSQTIENNENENDEQIIIWKEIGETPLEAINKLKENHLELKEKKMSFAGRLDPMAFGLMLVLVGNEQTKQQKNSELVTKEYEFEILFGLKTDTYDILGLCTNVESLFSTEKQKQLFSKEKQMEILSKCKQTLSEFTGKQIQSYPPFSAIHVKGKPLWLWAKQGKLDSVKDNIPKVEVTIQTLEIISHRTISLIELHQTIEKRIKTVKNPEQFRVNEILKRWNETFQIGNDEHHQQQKQNLDHLNGKELLIIRMKANVSAGCYIRSLCEKMGQKFDEIGAIAFEIKRTRIGEWTEKDLFKKESGKKLNNNNNNNETKTEKTKES